MRRARDKLPLLAILLLGLAWRLLLWSRPLHQPANDEVEYIRVAQDLLAGRGWVFYESWRWLRAPLYPLFLAGSLGLARANPALSAAEALHRAALPNLLLSVGLVYLIYRLTRELTPGGREGPALLAAAMATLLQTYATFASLYMSETLFSALFTAGLLALAIWRRRGGPGLLALAGTLLGLACLTRSAALVFLPVAALWTAWVAIKGSAIDPQRAPARCWARGLAAPALLAVGAALVIAPWTLRNCRAYEQCILIETGGAYNLWAFYEPRESLDEINRALEAIPNPIARADEATRRGLERLREDPTIVLRKIPAEWARLWAVKPIPDRFLLTSAYSDPPPTIFLSALLLDDTLYLIVLCAAPAGLAIARRDPLGTLLGLWVGVFIGATLFTHAEGRYRHFLFMALIPLAALALNSLVRLTLATMRRKGPPLAVRLPGPWQTAAMAMPLALALLPFFLYYPWEWAENGARRSLYRGAGDLLAWAGRDEAAGRAYAAAVEADETPDGLIVLGDLARRAGDLERATKIYERAHDEEPTYVGASAVWGDLLREQGRSEEARAAFRGRYLDQQRLTDWSYQMLRPAPAATVGVGDGLDFGYVGGVYKAEEQQGVMARWTDGRGRLRVRPAAQAAQIMVTLRAAAPRPNSGPVMLQICAGGRCEAVGLGPGWRTVRVLLPAAAGPLELRSPTFLAPDGRELGVLIDWARVEGVGIAEGRGKAWYNRPAAARRPVIRYTPPEQ